MKPERAFELLHEMSNHFDLYGTAQHVPMEHDEVFEVLAYMADQTWAPYLNKHSLKH